MEPVQHIFIYSSLRKGFQKDIFRYIAQYFSYESCGRVRGILTLLNGEPVATPSHNNNFIRGELFRLNFTDTFSWVIGQLDDYEGLDAEEGEKPLYRREITTVYRDDGTITNAWIYWYNGNVEGKPVINSGDVFEKQE